MAARQPVMSPDTDVLVIGSGPAGVSAAIPLVEAGCRTWIVDGGRRPALDVPDGEYLALRRADASQARWMLGDDSHALREQGATSPKLRAPTLAYAFQDYAAANGIASKGFTLTGSLAVGGLSNAWGCGVTKFAAHEWGDAALDPEELDRAYAAVAARIGLSGRVDDDLTPFFGVDGLAQTGIPLDALHEALLRTYGRASGALHARGFRLGRARLAVLAEDAGSGRRGCDGRGLCLWGCPRQAMYTSRYDLTFLDRQPGFRHMAGAVVERIERDAQGCWRAIFRESDGRSAALSAGRVLLAAGTMASTAIAMRSLPGFREAAVLHLPMAAFALWLPRFTGASVQPGTGTAQLAFTLDGQQPQEVCGYTFSTRGLPVSEFLRHAPLSLAAGAAVFRALLPACAVANCFLPARFTRSRLTLADDGTVTVTGGEADGVAVYADDVRRRLAAAFRRCGARLLPGTFTRGALGADVHYAGTMPMRAAPRPGECDADGELCGLPGVHVVDGAALPVLPAKSHTLALMANAHRIGAIVARRVRATSR